MKDTTKLELLLTYPANKIGLKKRLQKLKYKNHRKKTSQTLKRKKRKKRKSAKLRKH